MQTEHTRRAFAPRRASQATSPAWVGTIAGFGADDAIDLTDIVGSQATLAYTGNADGSGGTLSIGDGDHAASLALIGQYASAGFAVGAGANGAAVVTYVPPTDPTQPPALANGGH